MGTNEYSQPASKSSWDSQDFGDVNMVVKMAHFHKSSRPQWVNLQNGQSLYYMSLWYLSWQTEKRSEGRNFPFSCLKYSQIIDLFNIVKEFIFLMTITKTCLKVNYIMSICSFFSLCVQVFSYFICWFYDIFLCHACLYGSGEYIYCHISVMMSVFIHSFFCNPVKI